MCCLGFRHASSAGPLPALHLGQYGYAFSNREAIFATSFQSKLLLPSSSGSIARFGLFKTCLHMTCFSALLLYLQRLCKTFEVVFPEMRMGSKVLIQLHKTFYVFFQAWIRSVDFSICTATLIDSFAPDRQKKSTKTAYLSMS